MAAIYNKVVLGKDDLIYVYLIGDQTGESIKKLELEIIKLGQHLREQAKSILVMADLTKAKSVSLSARKAGIELMRNTNCDRGAIFGNPQLFNHLVNFIIIASGVGFKVKYFTNEKDAKEWLLS